MPSIDDYRVVNFTNAITHEAQQRGSNLSGGVTVKAGIVGKRDTFDRLDQSGDPEEVTSRHADTKISEADHLRRHLIPRDYAKAYMVDDEDLRKILSNPKNAYSQSLGMAFGRHKDKVIINAYDGDMLAGEEGTTTVSFPSTQNVPAGGANMTIEKWRLAREIMETNDVEEGEGPFQWHCAFAASQRKSLLSTTEMTSQDFNVIRALVNGQVNDFMGYMVHKTQLLKKLGDIRTCPFWQASVMVLGMTEEVRTFINTRADKNNNWQIQLKGGYGAARLDEKSVVTVDCDETA